MFQLGGEKPPTRKRQFTQKKTQPGQKLQPGEKADDGPWEILFGKQVAMFIAEYGLGEEWMAKWLKATPP